MPDEFNPYYVWLGIPPAEQPANYYRLLGIALFEPSADVIDSAADRQTAHLRTFQTGKHSDLSQRLLNEVAAARICLLDPKKRAEYDRQLRARLVVRTSGAPAAQPGMPQAAPGTPAAPILRRPAAATPAAPASPLQAADQWDDLLGPGDAKQRPAIARAAAQSRKAAAAKRAATNRMLAVGAAVGLAVLGVVGFIVYSQMNPAPATLVFDWPGVQRSDISASVDGAAILVPGSGPWEYACPPGEHHIVAQRPGYKLSETVTADAGQRQAVPANWRPKAALVLNWRPADRAGATLIVDGQPHPVSQQEPLELPVEPGRHGIQIIRPGIAPFSAAITLDADRREMVNVPRPPTEATLALAWPEAERSDAELTIDGTQHAAAAKAGANPAVLELTVPPGRHLLRITRPGFETFAMDVDLLPGPNHAIKPIWTPEKPAVADTGPKPAADEKPVHPVKKYPIPPAAEQQQIAKQLDDIYQLSKPGPVDPALAQRLLDVAAKPGSSPAERYLLLAKGAEKAVAAGDVALAMQVVDTLAADYEIAPLEVKQKLLERFVTLGKPDQVAAAIPLAEQLMDQAVAADEFELAIALATTAGKAAAKGSVTNRKETEDRLALKRHDFRMMMPMLAAAKKAEGDLAKNPDDPEANAKLGRWRCLYKSDWAGGLPLLAKSSDEKLKAVAEREEKAPTDAEQQAELADAWWDLSKAEGGIARDSLRLHAAEIYRAAMPNLTSALKKAGIEKRLAEVVKLKPVASTAAASRTPTPVAFPQGAWVDLLSHTDPARDRVSGTWSSHGSELSCDPDQAARLELPVVIDGGYDLQVEFTRASGRDDVDTVIPVGSHECAVALNGSGSGSDNGLSMIDGQTPYDGKNPTAVHDMKLENGHLYHLFVQVRILPSGRASVDVALDGRRLLPHWEGNDSSLAVQDYWRHPHPGRPVLGTWLTHVDYSSIRLRMASGSASWTAGPRASEPLVESPAVPTAASQAPSLKLGQWVDVLSLVDTKRDAVAGEWTRNDNGIISSTGNYPQISIPITVDGSYDFEVEFTRNSGIGDVATVFSIGSRSCLAGLSAFSGEVSGLCNLDGIDAHDLRNPIAVRPGTLTNNHRYREFLRVQSVSPGVARVNLSLDGKAYFPAWSGDPAALSVPPVWTPECPRGLKLGGPNVTFHSARLRLNSGHASSTFASATPMTEPADAPVEIAKPNPPQYKVGQWVDLLALVDTKRDTGSGDWTRNSDGITSGADKQPRIGIPVTIEGNYDLEVEFTRNSGKFDIGTIFSIGSHSCLLSLSAYGGKASGLCDLNGLDVNDPADPIAVRPGNLENGHRYRELLKIQSVSPTVARVAVSLDGKPYLPNWTGDPAVLSVNPNWGPGCPRGLALCGPDITFHSVRLRLNSGHASPTFAATTPVTQPTEELVEIAKPKSTQLKLGQWINFLPLIKIDRDRRAGDWEWHGKDLFALKEASMIGLPATIEGSYDVEFEFTRAGNGGDVDGLIPVGPNCCLVALSGYAGASHGLQMVDGQSTDDRSNNPTVVRPGTLNSGQRYRVGISVRLKSPTNATVDVALDGKRLLPHWEGNPVSLSLHPNWGPPPQNRFAICVGFDRATIHSVRLRMISGSATLDAAVTFPMKKPPLSGTYVVASKYNALYLAVSGDSKNEGTGVNGWPQPGDGKYWNFEEQPDGAFKVTNRNSGLVMGVRQERKDAGADVIQWGWGGSPGQLWLIEPVKGGYAKIVGKNSGLCLGIRASDGRTIIQEKWAGLPSQQWKLIPANP
jgi:hypothetical protein